MPNASRVSRTEYLSDSSRNRELTSGLIPALLGCLAAIGSVSLAYSQDTQITAQSESQADTDDMSSRAIDEIFVTARKRTESVLEVPESLTTFSADDLEAAKIETLSDIGLSVPNLFLSTRADGFPNVTIRGLGGFGNTQGVGFYLDDVQLFSDASSRFGDLERVEVLKGPQGILYGGSNIGGAIKFVSVRPDPTEFYGSGAVRVGEDGFFDGEASVNIPLSDKWAMRLFGFGATDDSYLTNPNSTRVNGLSGNNDPDIKSSEQYGGRFSIAGDITDRFRLYASARYNDLDGPNNTWSRELNGNFRYPDTVDASINPRHERKTSAATLNLEYDISDNVVMSSITSYTDTESRRQSELDLDPEYVLDLFRPEDLKAFTQEIRLTSTGTGPLQWQLGGYFLDSSRDLDSVLNIRGGYCFLDPGVCVPPPGPNDANIDAVAPFEVSQRLRIQKAVFANLDYSFGNFELSGGLRIDETTSKRVNLDTNVGGKKTETIVLGRSSLSWNSDDLRTLFYATFSQGFEPGDFSLNNFAGSNTLIGYDEERANQFEVGYKGRLADDTVLVTLAGFYIDYKDRQFELQATDPSGGFVEAIVNVGDSKQLGFEADLLWRMTDEWTLSGGVGYVDASWKDGTISPISFLDISGQRPPNATRWSGSAALDYSKPLTNEKELFGRVSARYKGDTSTNSQFFDVPGDDFPIFENPSFTVVDLTVGMKFGNVTVDVQAENIFDKAYYVDVQEFPNFAGAALPGAPGQIIIGTLEQPRRVRASLSVDF